MLFCNFLFFLLSNISVQLQFSFKPFFHHIIQSLFLLFSVVSKTLLSFTQIYGTSLGPLCD